MNKESAHRLSSALRKTGAYIIFLLSLAIILEAGARIIDSRTLFRHRALQMLSMLEKRTQPVKALDDLPWPPKKLYIRAPEPDPDALRDEVYNVGGKIIPGAHETLKIRLVSPETIKNEKSKKIFIVGESAAFGFPYLYPYSFGSILNNQLWDRNYSVINASQISYPSGWLVPIVRRIVDYYEPDTIIIFPGNNEWVNWKAYDPPWFLKKMIKGFRTVSESRFLAALIYGGFKYKAFRDKKFVNRQNQFVMLSHIEGFDYALANPFEEFFTYPKDLILQYKQRHLETFEHNLKKMIAIARRKNIRVILMNMPFNYKLCPAFMYPQPESYDPASEQEVRRRIQAAADLIRKEQYMLALTLIDEALALDPLPPVLHYMKGYALEKLGRLAEAEHSYALSRENMIGHLGARLSINRSIERVARETNTEFVDLKEIFDKVEHSLGGFFNEHLITDDCHPNPAGHRIIAATLYPLFQ